ncbi:MAG TPA: rhodanese-like domain-containing protein [Blastocatellia bacterium]|nr:rhodanese-like domain-containing protein [Blastocatellia bacterium]
MRFKKRIGVLALALVVFCVTTTFAYQQRVDLPGMKPPTKHEQNVQVEFITPEELKAKIANNESLAIVDLRSQASFEQSDQTIKGSLHTKVRRVSYRLRELPRDREIITYCACPSDEAAALGARALLANGFKRVRVLKGGWNAWIQAGGQVQPKPKV